MGKIPIGIEKGIGIEARLPTGFQVMHEGRRGARALATLLAQVKRGVEQRVWIAPFAVAMDQVVNQRIEIGRPHVRVFG